MFEKGVDVFPVKGEGVYLTHCGVAPMYGGAAEAMGRVSDLRVRHGCGVFAKVGDLVGRLHRSLGRMLGTDAGNVSFVKNTAEAMSLVAGGYPFEPGDEIISYVHEYPSNHYPWLLQERRGVVLKLLADEEVGSGLPADRPRGVVD